MRAFMKYIVLFGAVVLALGGWLLASFQQKVLADDTLALVHLSQGEFTAAAIVRLMAFLLGLVGLGLVFLCYRRKCPPKLALFVMGLATVPMAYELYHAVFYVVIFGFGAFLLFTGQLFGGDSDWDVFD